MIKFTEVHKQLGNFRLNDLNFELPKGYVMGLIGENGAGKTSMLNLILGLYQPDCGRIQMFGSCYQDDERGIRNKIGYVLADEDLFSSNTKLVDLANMYGRYYVNYNEKIFTDYCADFCLDLQKRWKQLSKGEKLKFQFAFALSHAPKLLVLDEPTANFDPEFRELFFHNITDFISNGEHSVILATHQLQDLDRIADYITLLHKGSLVFSCEKELLIDRFRLVKGEDYKVSLLKTERVIYKEKGEYMTSALVRHRRIDTYDSRLSVNIPSLEEIMYYFMKSGRLDVKKQ